MNKSIKTFAYATAASMLLLACNDTAELNASDGGDNNSSNVAEKWPKPYDPPLLITNDVEEWMKEQLASKSGEKRLISIFDMSQPEDFESTAEFSGTIDSDGKVEYYLNGKKISAEEYQSKWLEYGRQRANYSKRDLSIPGETRLDLWDNPYGWVVLMTAEELAELSEKYDKLAIEFYIEPMDE